MLLRRSSVKEYAEYVNERSVLKTLKIYYFSERVTNNRKIRSAALRYQLFLVAHYDFYNCSKRWYQLYEDE